MIDSIRDNKMFQTAVVHCYDAAIQLDNSDETKDPEIDAAKQDAHMAAYDVLASVVDAHIAQAVTDAVAVALGAAKKRKEKRLHRTASRHA